MAAAPAQTIHLPLVYMHMLTVSSPGEAPARPCCPACVIGRGSGLYNHGTAPSASVARRGCLAAASCEPAAPAPGLVLHAGCGVHGASKACLVLVASAVSVCARLAAAAQAGQRLLRSCRHVLSAIRVGCKRSFPAASGQAGGSACSAGAQLCLSSYSFSCFLSVANFNIDRLGWAGLQVWARWRAGGFVQHIALVHQLTTRTAWVLQPGAGRMVVAWHWSSIMWGCWVCGNRQHACGSGWWWWQILFIRMHVAEGAGAALRAAQQHRAAHASASVVGMC
ncbi:hypothetical protein COO60DRAFT_1060958 [Scenedesmus sp. NREL 46B-D3]|nr:hypothetical protein COO60DRAFT_1060958 [Scenedesmus sp. NREL 46B-D3]